MAQEDAEVRAMQGVVQALHDLEDEPRARVLQWAAQRYGVAVTGARRTGPGGLRQGSNEAHGGDLIADGEFEHFADLLDAANPTNDNTRALVGGYWFQVVKGAGTFTSQSANDELKNTGNRLSNITRSLDRLMAMRPALVIQVGKAGTTRQARKSYKLTTAGIRTVEEMIAGTGAGALTTEGDEE